MQGLRVQDLKSGVIYKCLLSNKNVLVIDNSYNKQTGFYDAVAVSWNEQTYSHNNHIIFDYQLQEIKEKPC